MNINDLFEEVNNNSLYKPSVPGYQNLEDDNSQLDVSDTRKTRLTLMQINKMRTMNDVRNYENKENLKVIQQQYGPTASEGDGMEF